MSINRRKFLKQAAYTGTALAAAAVLPTEAMAETPRRITILHTNDVHSRLEPFPMDGSRNQGLGGVAARAAVIEDIRNEGGQVLLLDAGDIFQGTPYFNLYKGEPEMKAMKMMGYDAATIGNHDFDAGMENFALQLELKGLVPENLYGKTVYLNPIEEANRNADLLRKQGCDMIICLSHLGDKYEDDKISDEILAKECYDIDLIIGGHTHRFFTEPRKYRNRKGGDTIVNQVGWAGIQLGRLDYSFPGKRQKNLSNAHTVVVGKKTRE